MKKYIITFFIVLTVGFALTGCGKYPSSWFATSFVHSNTSKNAYFNFGSLDGTISSKLKVDNSKNERIVYSASLEKGSATVYYDHDGTKKELFTISAGESISSSIGDFVNDTVYIIIETDGKCEDGKLDFDVKSES